MYKKVCFNRTFLVREIVMIFICENIIVFQVLNEILQFRYCQKKKIDSSYSSILRLK